MLVLMPVMKWSLVNSRYFWWRETNLIIFYFQACTLDKRNFRFTKVSPELFELIPAISFHQENLRLADLDRMFLALSPLIFFTNLMVYLDVIVFMLLTAFILSWCTNKSLRRNINCIARFIYCAHSLTYNFLLIFRGWNLVLLFILLKSCWLGLNFVQLISISLVSPFFTRLIVLGTDYIILRLLFMLSFLIFEP